MRVIKIKIFVLVNISIFEIISFKFLHGNQNIYLNVEVNSLINTVPYLFLKIKVFIMVPGTSLNLSKIFINAIVFFPSFFDSQGSHY